MLEHEVLKKMSGSGHKRAGLSKQYEILFNEKLHDLCRSFGIVTNLYYFGTDAALSVFRTSDRWKLRAHPAHRLVD
jgi:hypothetical protein